MAECYFIGVECVGLRHSTAVLATSDGQIRGVARLNSNITLHTILRRDLHTQLHRLLINVLRSAGLKPSAFADSTICIGLAGVTFPYNAMIEAPGELRALELGCPKFICTGDTEIIFAGMVRRDVGTALVCSMGSMAYVTTGSARRHFGGWGPLISDEGSAYAMGCAALRAIGSEYDRGEPPSVLWEELLVWLRKPGFGEAAALPDWLDAAYDWDATCETLLAGGLEDKSLRSVLFSFLHATAREQGIAAWRSVASSFTIPLLRAFSRGDSTAREIVDQAAEVLARQHYNACRIAGVTPDCGPLVLYGGVILHHPQFLSLLTRKLAECWPGVALPRPVTARDAGTMRPACGALLFALAGSTSEDLRLPPAAVIERLEQQHGAKQKWAELNND